MYDLEELLDMQAIPVDVDNTNLVDAKLEQMYYDSIFKHN